MTEILLVDDHALFREGLARLLHNEADVRITAQSSTVEEALQLLDAGNFHLILLDYELGDRRGHEVVAAVKARAYPYRILMVTVGLTKTELHSLLQNGVHGVFLKNNSPELLLEAIRAVMAGERWIDPKYQSLLADPSPEPFRRARFTDRDRQVLRGVFEGMANKEIAERLQVSESAIKASLQQLFSKTGVRTRSQLVRVAIEHYRRELLN
jgi:Response regulator containing a CheY-like receiver domain and an HTH DNA-binding domain